MLSTTEAPAAFANCSNSSMEFSISPLFLALLISTPTRIAFSLDLYVFFN
tara:strand:+ start:983 stop:1132 length:150 start_codon:yes stop_codon:yes gene_type:complete